MNDLSVLDRRGDSVVITEEEIREVLLGIHGLDGTAEGELIRAEMEDGQGERKLGCLMYSLEGAPPKGYALYIPGLQRLVFYDSAGEVAESAVDVEGVVEVNEIVTKTIDALHVADELSGEALFEQDDWQYPLHGHTNADFDRNALFERVLTSMVTRGVIRETDEAGVYELTIR